MQKENKKENKLDFYYLLLTTNYDKLSIETIKALSYHAFIEGDFIEEYLNNYKGKDKPKLLKTFLFLIGVYHESIN